MRRYTALIALIVITGITAWFVQRPILARQEMPYRVFLPLVFVPGTEYYPEDWCRVSRSLNGPGGDYFFSYCHSTGDYPPIVEVDAGRAPSPNGGTSSFATRSYYLFPSLPQGPASFVFSVTRTYGYNARRCLIEVREFIFSWPPVTDEAWTSGAGKLLGSAWVDLSAATPLTVTVPLSDTTPAVLLRAACEEDPLICTGSPEFYDVWMTSDSLDPGGVFIKVR